jgi:pyridoxine 5-phosphate synthase
MPKLGVNIDHIATLRQARGGIEPNPTLAAKIVESAGADSIVVHLREDRRHIQDRDLKILRRTVTTRLNLEMSIAKEIVDIACKIRSDQATLVPERRQELTTEGGLDVVRFKSQISKVTRRLRSKGIIVSLFIDPIKKQIDCAKEVEADSIELHTGKYANAKNLKIQQKYLKQLHDAALYAQKLGLIVNAGHGLNYQNTKAVAEVPGIEELNIGHSIISCAVFKGLYQAVKEMKELAGK